MIPRVRIPEAVRDGDDDFNNLMKNEYFEDSQTERKCMKKVYLELILLRNVGNFLLQLSTNEVNFLFFLKNLFHE